MTVRRAAVLAAAGLGVLGGDAAAVDFPKLGNLFRKKPKEEPPANKGKPPLDTLKGDTDEKRREAAAGELKDLDPRTNPEVVPSLISAMQRDPSPAVRSAAAEALGKLRPVQQSAGVALEQTVVSDPVESVRRAAQQSLWQYHLNGYRPAGAGGGPTQTAEPPLAKPKPLLPSALAPKPMQPTPVTAAPVTPPPVAAPVPVTPRPVTTGIGRAAVYPQTVEPPLAKPKSVPTAKEEPKPAPAPKADVAKPTVPAIPTVSVPTIPTVPPPAQPPSIPPPNG